MVAKVNHSSLAQDAGEFGRFEFVTGPLDLEATLDGGQAFRWWRETDGWWRGVIGRSVVRIRKTTNGVAVEQASVETEATDDLREKVRRYLAADVDIGRFSDIFAEDPCIAAAVKNFTGLRVLRQNSWECLVAFIASSVCNIPRIKLNMASLSSLGERIGDGLHDYAFPSPTVVGAAGEEGLRSLGFGFRARYVAEAARAVSEGRIDLEGLRSVSYEEAHDVLTGLNGVGDKVADCVLAFSLGKDEAFPVDRHVKRSLVRWYGLDDKWSIRQMADWARSHFGGWAALAQQYIFHRERLARRVSV